MYAIDIPELLELATGPSGAASEVAPYAPQATPSLEPASAASSWLQSSLLNHAPEPVFQETTSRCVRLPRGPPPSPSLPENANATADAWTAPGGNVDLGKLKNLRHIATHIKASDTKSSGFQQTQHRRLADANVGTASAALWGRQLEHAEADPNSVVDFQTATWLQPTVGPAACMSSSHHQPHATHLFFHLPSVDVDEAPAPTPGCTGASPQCAAARGVASRLIIPQGRGQAGALNPVMSQEGGLPAGPNSDGHSRHKRDSRALEALAQKVVGAERSKRPKSLEMLAAAVSIARSEPTWSSSVGEMDPVLAGPEFAVPAAAPPAHGAPPLLGLTSKGAPAGGSIPAAGDGAAAAVTVAAGTSSLLPWRPAAQRGVPSQLPSRPSRDLHGEASRSNGRPNRYDGHLSVLHMVQPGAEGRRPEVAAGGRPQGLPAQAGIGVVGAGPVSFHLGLPLGAARSGVDSEASGDVEGAVVEAGGVLAPVLLRSVGDGGTPAPHRPDQLANERTPGLAPSSWDGAFLDGSTRGEGTDNAAALPVTGPALMPAGEEPFGNSRALSETARALQQILSGAPDHRRPSDDHRRPAGREALLQALIASTTRYYLERGLPID